MRSRMFVTQQNELQMKRNKIFSKKKRISNSRVCVPMKSGDASSSLMPVSRWKKIYNVCSSRLFIFTLSHTKAKRQTSKRDKIQAKEH